MLTSNQARHFTLATATALLIATSALADDALTFEAPDGGYTFQYPADFVLDHEFADGTGDVTGVTASTPENGDVNIAFYARPAAAIAEVSEATRQAVIDDYTKQVAVLPSIKFQSAMMTTMLGQPAVDMVFENKRFGAPQINRFVATIREGKEYNITCFYSVEKAATFAPACDLAVSTVKLQDAAEPSGAAAPAGGACDKLELNKRAGQVSDLTAELLAGDQSPEMVARVKTAHDAMIAIDERAGSAPSEQDCKDMDAVAETLK